MQKTQNPASPCQVSRAHCEIRHSFTSHICSTLTFPSRLRLTLLFIYRTPWRKLYGPGISKILESPLPFRLFFLSVAPRGFWHCQTVPVLTFSPRSHQPYIFHDYKTSTPWKMLSAPVSCDILAYMQQNYVRFYVLIRRKEFHRRLLSSTRNPTLILGLIPFNNLDFYKMEHPMVGTGVGLRICLQDFALLTQYSSGSFSSVVQICLTIIASSAPA